VRHRRLRHLALLAGAALATFTFTTQVAGAEEPYGPSVPYTQILNGQFTFVPLPDAALVERTQYGYVYKAGQQDSHLVVTEVPEGLRFHDSGTLKFASLPASCRRQAVAVGVAAVCAVPTTVTTGNHMLVEVWPRLGDDYVDASSLSARFDVSVLADAGVDVVMTGAGNDFVNGAFDRDRVYGGAGNDWIRTGTGDDVLLGEAGNDKLVGSDHHDVVHGGSGNDRVDGGVGPDALWAEAGQDTVSCGGGPDSAYVDGSDRTRGCETVSTY
jgi:serralysin